MSHLYVKLSSMVRFWPRSSTFLSNSMTCVRSIYHGLSVSSLCSSVSEQSSCGLNCAANFCRRSRKPMPQRILPINIVMTFATVAMYLSSTAHFGLSFFENFTAIFDQGAATSGGLDSTLNDLNGSRTYSQIALEILNVRSHIYLFNTGIQNSSLIL